MVSVRSNNLSLKYHRRKPSGCIDKGIKNLRVCQKLNSFVRFTTVLFTRTCVRYDRRWSIYFRMYHYWNNDLHKKSPKTWNFQTVVWLFCAVNIAGDIETFVQLSILLSVTKVVKILTKFFISSVKLKAQKKGRPHYGNAKIRGIVLLILAFFS